MHEPDLSEVSAAQVIERKDNAAAVEAQEFDATHAVAQHEFFHHQPAGSLIAHVTDFGPRGRQRALDRPPGNAGQVSGQNRQSAPRDDESHEKKNRQAFQPAARAVFFKT